MRTIPSRTGTVCRLSNCQTHGSVRSVVRPNPRTKKPWTVLVVCGGCTRKRRPNRQTLTRVRCVPVTRVPNQSCITIPIPTIAIIINNNTTITITIDRVRYGGYLLSDLPCPICTCRCAGMRTIPSRTATACRLSNSQTHGSVRSVVRPNPRTKKPWTVLVVCDGCTRKRRPNRQTLTRVRCVSITHVPNQSCITIAITTIVINHHHQHNYHHHHHHC